MNPIKNDFLYIGTSCTDVSAQVLQVNGLPDQEEGLYSPLPPSYSPVHSVENPSKVLSWLVIILTRMLSLDICISTIRLHRCIISTLLQYKIGYPHIIYQNNIQVILLFQYMIFCHPMMITLYPKVTLCYPDYQSIV